MRLESAFGMDTSSIKYGPGVTREVGHDMIQLGARRVMVVTDPYVSERETVAVVSEALRSAGIEPVLFNQVRIEPTDESFQAAIAFAKSGGFDGFVAVGGGSSIDTAKAANLYATYPADFELDGPLVMHRTLAEFLCLVLRNNSARTSPIQL